MSSTQFAAARAVPYSVMCETVREAVDAELTSFLAAKAVNATDDCLPSLVRVIGDFCAGGKRLRPLFCHLGWTAAGGDEGGPEITRVGAALELFHAFALIHDDIMDASDHRRGRPTVHRVMAAWADGPSDGAAARFGVNAAILLGDLCLVWSDELLQAALGDAERVHAARPLLDAMRTEIMVGQYLDLGGEASDPAGMPWRVIRHKTAAYTVERPLQIGAALAGGDDELLATCAAYGRPLGEAFQLRDDLLGVFGDPAVTGKSALDDLRSDKHTVLMAIARERATPAQLDRLDTLLGDLELDEEGAGTVRRIIRETGADGEVERLIGERRTAALDVLSRAGMPAHVAQYLADVADQAIERDR